MQERFSNQEGWKESWGMLYGPIEKIVNVGQLLQRLDREGKIGKVVLDVGSGAKPVSNFLSSQHQFITVDYGGKLEQTDANKLHIQSDIESLANAGSFAQNKAITKGAQFLNIDSRRTNRETIDCIIFSEILNYIDFRKIILQYSRFQPIGGRIVIYNQPNRGLPEFFSERGVKGNSSLVEFLTECGYEIEILHYPNDFEEKNKEMVLIVARKIEQK